MTIHKTQAHLNRVRAHETGVGSGFQGGLSDEGTKYVGLGLEAEWNDSSVRVGAVKLREAYPNKFLRNQAEGK